MSDEQNLVAVAQAVAYLAHRGQVDKAGKPYIEHPADVARRVKRFTRTWEVEAVAWLHDVLEDTDVTTEDLRACGFGWKLVGAVVAITRQPNETVESYYARVKENDWALIVKREDIASNTDIDRLALLDDETILRLTKKYAKARRLLGLVAA